MWTGARAPVRETAPVIPLWASICGYGAATFSIISATTQSSRVVRARSIVGISPSSWLIGSLSSIAWFAYGISVRSPQQTVANGWWMFYVVPCTWFMLLPRGRAVARWGIVAVVATFAALFALGTVAPSAPGWIGMPASMAMLVPQVVYSFRHGRGPGISRLGWAFLATSSSLWFLYGIGAGDWPVIINTSIGMVLSWTVAVMLIVRPSRHDAVRIPVAS